MKVEIHSNWGICWYSNLADILIDDNVFIVYRDAEDAVHARDGYDYDGYRLRVEFPRGGGPSGFRGGNRGNGGSSMGRGRGPPARRSQYRVLVTGMLC